MTTTEATKIRFGVSFNADLRTLPKSKAEKDRMAGSLSATGWQAGTSSPERLAELLSKGIAIAPIYKDGHRSNETFESIQFLALDFDTDTDTAELLAHPSLSKFLMVIGNTASHSLEHPRCRAILPLDEPIRDREQFKNLANRFLYLLRNLNPDSSSNQATRFYLGYQEDSGFVHQGELLTVQYLESLTDAAEQDGKIVMRPPRQKASNGDAYEMAALADEVAKVESASNGNRNNQLNTSAYKLAQLDIEESTIETELKHAALTTGLSESETDATIKSGTQAGKQNPRTKAESTERNTKSTKPEGGEGKQKKPIPTPIELGDELMQKWSGNTRFFREAWHQYKKGLWKALSSHAIRQRVWRLMKKKNIKTRSYPIAQVLDYLTSELFVENEDVDLGADFIPLQNGLYHLKSGELEDHQRGLFLTSQLEFDYDPTADCPRWLGFLDQMIVDTSGNPDLDLINVIQEGFGYSLTMDTRLHTSFWLYGRPATGKSTVIEVLQLLAGNAFTHLDLGALDTNHYQLALLAGKRIATCTESPAGAYLADHYFKSLVSGEVMQVRQIRQEPFVFRPTVKLWWAMNSVPRIKDRSGGVYRRMKVIPFNNPLPRNEWDTQLIDKLKSELAGIFNWSIEGLHRLREQGDFSDSKQINEAVDSIARENDTEAAFVDEWCDREEKAEIKSGDLYRAYRLWCKRNGNNAKSANKVARDWQRLGFNKDPQRRNDGHYWLGISLNLEGLKADGFTTDESEKIPF